MANEEIEAVQAPHVLLRWDPKLMAVHAEIGGTNNLDLVLMMLEGAKVQLQFQRNMVAANQMAAQQEEMRKAQRLAQQVNRNGGIIR